MTCKQCKNFDECQFDASCQGLIFDPNFDGKRSCTAFDPFTNADRIRAMSDEELAKFLDDCNSQGCVCPTSNCWASCRQCIAEWLKQPADEERDSNATP